MSKDRRRVGGLATRFLRVATLVGVSTVVAAGVVGVVSIYRLSSEAMISSDRTLTQLVENRVESRAATIARLGDRAALAVSQASTEESLTYDLDVVYGANSGMIEGIYVADPVGLATVAIPAASDDATCYADVFTRALEGRTGFLSMATCGRHGWDLWMSRTVLRPSGEPAVLMIDIDTEFVAAVLETTVESGSHRTIVFAQADAVLASVGEVAAVELGGGTWTSDGAGAGRVTLPHPNGPLTGVFNDIEVPEGASWRVLVLEPPMAGLGETIRAVAPSLLVLIIGGVVALVAGWSASTRVVRPLIELERAARAAAAGAYVKPITTTGDDEIAQVADAFNQVALRLNALHDLSQLLASAARFDQVIDGILASVRHLVGPGKAVAYLLDGAGVTLVPAAARGVELSALDPIPIDDECWLGRALFDAELAEITDDAERVARELPTLADGEECAVAAPLVAGNAPLGVVVVLKQSGTALTEAEREMLRTFSAQAAVAVQTSRLFEIESRSRRIAESLRAVAEELVSTDGLAESFVRVEEIVRDLFDAVAVRILVVDRHALGLPPSTERQAEAEMIGLALRTIGEDGSAIINRGGDEADDAVLERLEAEELLAVPVAIESDHGAVLLIALPQKGAGLADVELAESVGDEVALALDNAYHYERAVTRAVNLETIFRISQAVGSPLQVNVVLNRVMDVVQKLLSADGVALVAYDARRRTLTTSMARGQVPADLVKADFAPGEDIPGYVFDSSDPVILRDLKPGGTGVLQRAAAMGLRSLVAVPLLARSRAIGVLLVFSEEVGAFSDEDVSLLQTFASQAALAIDTARLYSREHEVASVLQQSILPEELPVFEEVDSGSVYEPVGSDNEIGGDYYDLFRAPSGEIWMVIADVCGKGIHAATKTSMIKYAVRALVAAGMSPGSVLGEVNRMVSETGEISDIVTVWAGRYESQNGRIVWASGGHPPAMLRRADGTDARLDPTGPLLGAIPDVVYDEGVTPFGDGDRVVLYTDGVTEARQGNTFFGEDRLMESFSLEGSAMECAQAILDDVQAFTRGPLRDDVAVLCVSALRLSTRDDEVEGRRRGE